MRFILKFFCNLNKIINELRLEEANKKSGKRTAVSAKQLRVLKEFEDTDVANVKLSFIINIIARFK